MIIPILRILIQETELQVHNGIWGMKELSELKV